MTTYAVIATLPDGTRQTIATGRTLDEAYREARYNANIDLSPSDPDNAPTITVEEVKQP
jgi:hypothetical protein